MEAEVPRGSHTSCFLMLEIGGVPTFPSEPSEANDRSHLLFSEFLKGQRGICASLREDLVLG